MSPISGIKTVSKKNNERNYTLETNNSTIFSQATRIFRASNLVFTIYCGIIPGDTGFGSIVWCLGYWLGKDILGFFKNIVIDNS